MNSQSDMDVLLIGDDPQLRTAMQDAGFSVLQVPDGSDLYATLENARPLAVLLREDSPSRDTLEHLASLSRKFPQPALLLHDGSDQALSRRALELGISAYVSQGVSAEVIKGMIQVSISQHRKVESLRKELARSQKSLAERKQVNAAKCRLMEQQGWTEVQAYQNMKQRAMNQRQSLVEIAKLILSEENAT